MTVAITTIIQGAYTNGTTNDGSEVTTEFTTLYANDVALAAKVDTLLSGGIEDAVSVIIDSDNAGASAGNMSYLMNRGSTGSDVGIRWNETDDLMELTNDGTYWSAMLQRNFIEGLKITYSTASQLTIGIGSCMDSTNKYLMKLTAGRTYKSFTTQSATAVDCRQNYAGNADTGAWYYLFLIGKTDGTTATLSSAHSATTVHAFPTGYTFFRLIGAFRQTAASNIRKFYESGNGKIRDYYWDDLVGFGSFTPTAGSWTDLSLATVLPVLNTQWAWLDLTHYHTATTTASATPVAKIRTNGSAATTYGMMNVDIKNLSTGTFQSATKRGLVYTDSDGVIEHTRSIASVNAYLILSAGYRMEL